MQKNVGTRDKCKRMYKGISGARVNPEKHPPEYGHDI